MTHPLISATFIYDGSAAPSIPERMLPLDAAAKAMDKENAHNGLKGHSGNYTASDGSSGNYVVERAHSMIAAKGQMQGTPMEQLVELAGRVCYDSLGVGRDSASYHKHILEVGHLSVLEHAVFTVEVPLKSGGGSSEMLRLVSCFLNRPALRLSILDNRLRVTLNLRHIVEWASENDLSPSDAIYLGRGLRSTARQLAPAIVRPQQDGEEGQILVRLAKPESDHEQWATYLLTGSRGFSHELVRHGDWTAISQRSTRYVDESESPWVQHPLLNVFFDAGVKSEMTPNMAMDAMICVQAERECQTTYTTLVSELEAWLISKGVDKFSARKQARGAARGYLGNALYTEVVFSASITQWKHMIRMRACAAADAEIREVFVQVFKDMAMRYAERFTGWTVRPAPDGIGEVVVPA